MVLEAGLPLSISFRVSPAHTMTIGRCEIVFLSPVNLLLHVVSNEIYPILKREGWANALEQDYFCEGGCPKIVEVWLCIWFVFLPTSGISFPWANIRCSSCLRSTYLRSTCPSGLSHSSLTYSWVIPCSNCPLSVSLLRPLGFHSYPRPFSEVASFIHSRVPTIISSSPHTTLTLNLTLIFDVASLILTFTHWVR